MKPFLVLAGCALVASAWAEENPLPATAPVGPQDTRPATAELSVQPLRMPNGDSAGLLAGSWLVAVNDEWGFGPTVLGTAKGNYGGVFVFGVTGQRRWRLGAHSHLAANLTVGAGGGLGSPSLRFGGGLMLRPELQLRQEFGEWYLGAGVAHTRFPSGNVRDTTWTLTLGRMDDFRAFAPRDVGRPGRTYARGGVGFDEMALSGGFYTVRGGSRSREGQLLRERLGRAGADARQYIAPDAWWGVEAAGAAKGGIDGYMEVLVNAGTDWALFNPQLRLGVQGGVGLGGGGGVDTGSGRLWRLGPTLRWITPWGPSLRLDANRTQAMNGRFSANETRLSLVLPLEGRRSVDELGRDREDGTVRVQTLVGGVQHHRSVRFKDGSRQGITKAVLGVTRELGSSWYGTAQGNAAAGGKAGAYAIGLFGVGVQSSLWGTGPGRWRTGVEGLVGAAGGGGVAVGGGAVGQAEAWLQWEGSGAHERLRVRLGAGQWGTLRGSGQRSPFVGLSVGYAYGVLGS
jgi:hypothetical protein